ncbi:hypothetical protein ACLKA6_018032 [Drosophila palustris]
MKNSLIWLLITVLLVQESRATCAEWKQLESDCGSYCFKVLRPVLDHSRALQSQVNDFKHQTESLTKVECPEKSYDGYWIDINDLGTEGVFLSATTGVRPNYFHWHKGEPNNAGKIEDCVSYNKNYMMNDDNFPAVLGYKENCEDAREAEPNCGNYCFKAVKPVLDYTKFMQSQMEDLKQKSEYLDKLEKWDRQISARLEEQDKRLKESEQQMETNFNLQDKKIEQNVSASTETCQDSRELESNCGNYCFKVCLRLKRLVQNGNNSNQTVAATVSKS